MRYLVLTYGRDSFEKLSHVYGGRLIPFGINRALQDVIGIGFDEPPARLSRTRASATAGRPERSGVAV